MKYVATINGKKYEVELEKLQGSKYVQSDVKQCFNEMISYLKEGKKVLFSGTPCQVAAIKSCTRGRFEDNLFTIDIICHGVPSLKFFNDYLQAEKNKKGIDIKKFIFRDKQYGWGTKGSILGIKDGKMIVEPINSRTSSYYSFFLDGEIYRDCCYQCPFAQEKDSHSMEKALLSFRQQGNFYNVLFSDLCRITGGSNAVRCSS